MTQRTSDPKVRADKHGVVTVELLQRDVWLVVLCTVRYACGRSTYVVSEACDLVRRMRGHLLETQVSQLAREVQKQIDGGMAGMKCDVAEWTSLVKFLREP